MTLRSTPGFTKGRNPARSTAWRTASTSASGAPACMMMTIASVPARSLGGVRRGMSARTRTGAFEHAVRSQIASPQGERDAICPRAPAGLRRPGGGEASVAWQPSLGVGHRSRPARAARRACSSRRSARSCVSGRATDVLLRAMWMARPSHEPMGTCSSRPTFIAQQQHRDRGAPPLSERHFGCSKTPTGCDPDFASALGGHWPSPRRRASPAHFDSLLSSRCTHFRNSVFEEVLRSPVSSSSVACVVSSAFSTRRSW